jgi:hypothetical protein
MENKMKYTVFGLFFGLLFIGLNVPKTFADAKSTAKRMQEYGNFSDKDAMDRAKKLEEIRKKNIPSPADAKKYINQGPNKRGGAQYN